MNDQEWEKWFEEHGPAVGDPMLDATLVRLDGTEAHLSELWRDRPAIITTASLTCPIARDRAPRVDRLLSAAETASPRTENGAARGVIYCREAHPVGSPAPHGEGREWVTPANRWAGILHTQPQTLEERLALAKLLHRNWLPDWEFLVDRMDDTVYETLGTASCMGFVVDRNGIVRAKHGWLDPGASVRLVRQLTERDV